MAQEVVRIQEHYYIHSTSARVDDRTRVLKHDDTFALFDRFGDLETFGTGELGIYHQDTRHLSRFTLRLAGMRPLLLSSSIKDDNAVLAVDLMNPDIENASRVVTQRGDVHVFRSKVLWRDTCHERLRIHNYGLTAVDMPLVLEFDADFADIFEVRGTLRARRGRRLPVETRGDLLVLAYEGLDGRVRRTRIRFDPAPDSLSEVQACYQLRLPPRDELTCRLAIACTLDSAAPTRVRAGRPAQRRDATLAPETNGAQGGWYEESAHGAVEELARARSSEPHIFTSNEQFNDWLNRSRADLHMMRTLTPHGPYPYAGVPWFSTAFGRDGIITALECLWFDPLTARGVLSYLADTQADAEDAEQDAEPGKILHETREGEMAALGEVPFGRYYGSVDATPLFVVLAGAHYERTGDLEFTRTLWPHVERALAWISRYGDRDGDGFVEYARRSPKGLVQQGWKDSRDSVFHQDGTLVEGSVALCEVQGYAYAALSAASALALTLGMEERAEQLKVEAHALRRRFEERFWCEDLSTYALALDGEKRPCRVRTSNPGHCLFTGIADEDHARRVAATLTDESSFSGWGIRTVATNECRYNPMSYHNGSVWPHDSALVAAGFARYGMRDQAVQVLQGLFDATLFLDMHRLPELFCGFQRRLGEGPTLYPVSCSPQAWASGSVFLLLQACLGIEVRAAEHKVILANPCLPPFLEEVHIDGLRVGDAKVDLLLTRYGRDVGINVPQREGKVSVVALK